MGNFYDICVLCLEARCSGLAMQRRVGAIECFSEHFCLEASFQVKRYGTMISKACSRALLNSSIINTRYYWKESGGDGNSFWYHVRNSRHNFNSRESQRDIIAAPHAGAIVHITL